MKHVIYGAEQLVIVLTWTLLYQKLFPQAKSRKIIWGVVHVLLTGTVACLCGQFLNRQLIPLLCIGISGLCSKIINRHCSSLVIIEALITYVLTKALWMLSIWACFFLLFLFEPEKHALAGAFCISAIHILLCLIAMKRMKASTCKIYAEKYSLIIVSVSSVLFIISYAMTSVAYIRERREVNIFSIFVIVAALTILIAWTLSDAQRSKEAKEQKEHIDTLVRSAHKYKEIIPAVERELKEMQMKINADSNHDWAPELGVALEEITALRKGSDQVSAQELSAVPNFASTGLALLDSQLQAEQEAAAQNGVIFDCAIMSSVTALIETGVLTQFQLQQMVGDLFRNALKAVQDARGEGGRILLILGNTEDGYQIKMCDTGVPFPQEVLGRLGERGVTTGGTGHGLADICELLGACRASLEITQYLAGSGFTKAVSVLFDGKAERRI